MYPDPPDEPTHPQPVADLTKRRAAKPDQRESGDDGGSGIDFEISTGVPFWMALGGFVLLFNDDLDRVYIGIALMAVALSIEVLESLLKRRRKRR